MKILFNVCGYILTFRPMRTFHIFESGYLICKFTGDIESFEIFLEEQGLLFHEWKVLGISDISPQPKSCS